MADVQQHLIGMFSVAIIQAAQVTRCIWCLLLCCCKQ